jgi:hypothetical protein
MAYFVVESHHTARECIWALREVHREGWETLGQYHWGCKDGVHTGWAILEASTKFDVQASIPRILRSQTRIVRLNRFTLDEVVAFHESALVETASR